MICNIALSEEEFAKVMEAGADGVAIIEYVDGKPTGKKAVFKPVTISKSIEANKTKPKQNDKDYIRPDYYGGEADIYEPRKVIRAWGLDWNLGTAIKYLERLGNKPGETKLKDLKKALTYVHFAIEDEEERLAAEKRDK